jgi:hypothetical protein
MFVVCSAARAFREVSQTLFQVVLADMYTQDSYTESRRPWVLLILTSIKLDIWISKVTDFVFVRNIFLSPLPPKTLNLFVPYSKGQSFTSI